MDELVDELVGKWIGLTVGWINLLMLE